ncbi:hypothetical protein GCM10011512_08850 [Tersicoccus solisilvae]|uniref:Immunity protein 63 domain-containing protein n=1 Tax=Tersicoccus solisilvae TaxID=1882339 RepID=A0ABQ1NSD0_9MICC|nr:hypothetical protein [Tersicoccus solisilvae]GGC84256.1 hypothetical protein GCM10011512_08850 [Tersicoccus solisilvae]
MGNDDYTERSSREAVDDALTNKAGARARKKAALALGDAMIETGEILWHAGYFVGPDRVIGDWPSEFGSNSVVGISTALQIGGELIESSARLLEAEKRYAAMALIRQVVEVEYLGWAFAEDANRTAATWLHADSEERRKLWQPRHLRDSSSGLFRGSDYALHCERGGHPTPEARRFLPGHSDVIDEGFIWYEICVHGGSAWDYFMTALDRQPSSTPFQDHIESLKSFSTFRKAWENWQADDMLIDLVGTDPMT